MSAYVVFCDLAGYSGRDADQMISLFQLLNTTARECRTAHSEFNISVLPTGDGVALVLNPPGKSNSAQIAAAVASVVIQLSKVASSRGVKIRVGIHCGQVFPVKDANDVDNAVGPVINIAQRIMDGANDNQILISFEAHSFLFGQEQRPKINVENMAMSTTGPYPIVAKRGLEQNVFATCIDGTVFTDTGRPKGSDEPVLRWSHVSAFDSIKNRICEAESIALVHLSASEILDPLEKLFKETRLSKLKEMDVFMPDPKWYYNKDPMKKLIWFAEHGDNAATELPEMVKRWRLFLLGLKSASCRVRLGRMLNPPYFGGQFFDWKKRGGTIRVGPFIWRIEATKCPAFELRWTGARPQEMYETYCRGLDNLEKRVSQWSGWEHL